MRNTHTQIDQTKLIYSHCDGEYLKLYSIEQEDGEYFIRQFEENELSV